MITQPTKKMLLPVPLYEQEQTNWCWAACYQMLKKYRDGVKISQSEIVAASGQSGNASASTGVIEALLDDPQVKITKKGPEKPEIKREALSEEALCQQISRGNPVLIVWQRKNMRHLVLICGWEDVGEPGPDIRFTVNNPELPTPQRMAYRYLLNAVNQGDWVETLTGV